MRKPLLACMILASGGILATAAWACGDKLMLSTASLRFRQVNGDQRPAAILAYLPPKSPVWAVLNDLERQSLLKKAGHTFASLDDPSKLEEALRTRKYDLLVVEAADAENLQRQLQSLSSKPTVLPVMYQAGKLESDGVEKKFRCILKAPNAPARYLAAVEQAMDLKLKTVR